MHNSIGARPQARRHEVFDRTTTSIGAAVLAFGAMLAPSASSACACGCGVFDVGTGAMFPDGAGGMISIQADFLDQNKNWSGTSEAPAAANADKQIKSEFYTLGAQYYFNRSWGVAIDLPYWMRKFTTTDDAGNPVSFDHAALGDIRIRGSYTGFSDDMSTGLTFGVKLASGDANYANFDPDSEIGTGSTDLLLGAYHLGKLTSDGRWDYFVRGQWQKPVKQRAIYHPGQEFVAAAGTYYQGWAPVGGARVVPVLQMTAAYRGRDRGEMGDPDNSGYGRLIIQPGVEVDLAKVRLYAEAGFSVYDHMVGNQLVSKQMYKLSASYVF